MKFVSNPAAADSLIGILETLADSPMLSLAAAVGVFAVFSFLVGAMPGPRFK